jgi:hypothetical protein
MMGTSAIQSDLLDIYDEGGSSYDYTPPILNLDFLNEAPSVPEETYAPPVPEETTDEFIEMQELPPETEY